MLLLLALAMGVIAGLRTFTAPAAFFLARGGVAGYILAVFAIGEYIADALPKIPPRTGFPSIIIRPLSGAVTGWFIASLGGVSAGIGGAIAGVIGALMGTYGGYHARLAAITKFGAVPAAILEDVIAIALAALVMSQYITFEHRVAGVARLLSCVQHGAC